MTNYTTDDFKQIVLNNTPLIDVRAPIEYEKGAFPTSINLPIMNNEERHLVGTCYKQNGNAEATRLGYQLVSRQIKEERIAAWTDYIKQHPDTMIYCFRGGSRSRIAQEWICDALGQDILRLEGGYKAFRNYLLDVLNHPKPEVTPLLLTGFTGSGKTLLLKQLEQSIDLEGLANHRGSSFGAHITPQPTQINFENNLAYALIRHQAKGYKHIIIEDEGKHIGHNFIPRPLLEYFHPGDLVLMDVPLDERVQITLQEYVIDAQAEYLNAYGDIGLSYWFDYISSSITRVQKRLGGDRYQTFYNLFTKAYEEQLMTGSYEPHRQWIYLFLAEYYDPMYAYQLTKTHRKIAFKGNAQDILDYFKDLCS